MATEPSVFLTGITTFILGDEKKLIPVHSGVLARLSEPFGALLNPNSGFKEAETKIVSLPDTSTDVFLKLCNYAYSHAIPNRDLRVRSTQKLVVTASQPVEEQILEPPPEAADDEDWGHTWGASSKKKKKGGKGTLAEEPTTILRHRVLSNLFNTTSISPALPDAILLEHRPLVPVHDDNHDPIVLAQLYRLAKEKLVIGLCKETLSDIHASLARLKPVTDHEEKIIQFVRDAYKDHHDELRRLAVLFLGAIWGEIGLTEGFEDLLAEGGPLVVDFHSLLFKNVSWDSL